MDIAFQSADIEPALPGRYVYGTPWQRFGLYNSYVVVGSDGRILKMPAHAGELVPGSTEDLVAALDECHGDGFPAVPMTVELDPTYQCTSHDCGGYCFSAGYRSMSPSASIPYLQLERFIREFRAAGGRILRFDGGGDPLAHKGIRSGALVELAASQGLKTTILTSGDLLDRSDLARIAESGCYVRVSLNASTNRTREAFHGNEIPLTRILNGIEELSRLLTNLRSDVPVGATFLLAPINFLEVAEAARMARSVGIRHFSVRRILGPEWLRPTFGKKQSDLLNDLLSEVRQMHSDDFRVAVPYRPVAQPDLNPANGEFCATQCWQSTLKTVVEPNPGGGIQLQLCGRYRGGGVGQRLAMPALVSLPQPMGWVERWQESFTDFPVSRKDLLKTCVSCIDRGFILMVDRLVNFLRHTSGPITILHLDSPTPHEVVEWNSRASSVSAKVSAQ